MEHQGFTQLYLSPSGSSRFCSANLEALHYATLQKDTEQRPFSTADSLLEFVTKQWERRWVTTHIWDEDVFENFVRRPLFILVSVDAPISLRWKRYKEKSDVFYLTLSSRNADEPYRTVMHKQTPPTLDDFVRWSDDHLYDQRSGLAWLIDRAELRLVNQTSSLEKLHDALKELNLTDNQRLRPDWDQYFMQLASLAARRSNCMKRRVGCVLVREKRVISTGYNGTPRNLRNCNEGGCESFSCRSHLTSFPDITRCAVQCWCSCRC